MIKFEVHIVLRDSKPLTATLEARKHYAGSKGSTECEEQAIKRRRQNRNCAAKNRTLETAEHADVHVKEIVLPEIELFKQQSKLMPVENSKAIVLPK